MLFNSPALFFNNPAFLRNKARLFDDNLALLITAKVMVNLTPDSLTVKFCMVNVEI